MKELIERLRYPVICTLGDRLEAADALERLTAEKMNLAADIVEIATLRDKLLGDRNAEIERLTSHDQFLAGANKQWIADCARLTAELAKVEVHDDTALLRQALEAFENVAYPPYATSSHPIDKVITALRERLGEVK